MHQVASTFEEVVRFFIFFPPSYEVVVAVEEIISQHCATAECFLLYA